MPSFSSSVFVGLLQLHLISTTLGCIPTESPEDDYDELLVSSTTTATTTPTCPSPWTFYNAFCYLAVGTMSANQFSTADADCVTRANSAGLSNGHVVSDITDLTENDFVRMVADDAGITPNFWIGLEYVGGGTTTAGNYDPTDYRWATGNAAGPWSNWAGTEPSDPGLASGDCTVMDVTTGFWDDASCRFAITHPYVCKARL